MGEFQVLHYRCCLLQKRGSSSSGAQHLENTVLSQKPSRHNTTTQHRARRTHKPSALYHSRHSTSLLNVGRPLSHLASTPPEKPLPFSPTTPLLRPRRGCHTSPERIASLARSSRHLSPLPPRGCKHPPPTTPLPRSAFTEEFARRGDDLLKGRLIRRRRATDPVQRYPPLHPPFAFTVEGCKCTCRASAENGEKGRPVTQASKHTYQEFFRWARQKETKKNPRLSFIRNDSSWV